MSFTEVDQQRWTQEAQGTATVHVPMAGARSQETQVHGLNLPFSALPTSQAPAGLGAQMGMPRRTCSPLWAGLALQAQGGCPRLGLLKGTEMQKGPLLVQGQEEWPHNQEGTWPLHFLLSWLGLTFSSDPGTQRGRVRFPGTDPMDKTKHWAAPSSAETPGSPAGEGRRKWTWQPTGRVKIK